MKSDIDIKDDIYRLIQKSDLKKAITGSVSKTKRPKDSKLEDVVISVLANHNAQRQEAFVVVNVYVKDDNVNGQNEECSQRLRTLCQLCFSLFERFSGPDYRLSIAEDAGQKVLETENAEHVISNKLLYQTINE